VQYFIAVSDVIFSAKLQC